MATTRLGQTDLKRFVETLSSHFNHPATILLVGESSLVWEGVRDWTTQVDFTADVDEAHQAELEQAIRTTSDELDQTVLFESPAEIVPLPDGYRDRCVAASDQGASREFVRVLHFDPYSVAFRFVARGDEPDYHIALSFLDAGWVTEDGMTDMLEELLPKFSFETIQQDPAEFRRKYKGLLQMARATRPRQIHRPTPA